MQIKIEEAQILSPSITSRRELKFSLKAKVEDYTEEDRNAIFDAFENGDSVAVVLVPFQKEQDQMPKLRQRLALLMKEYCEKEGYKENEEESRLYARHGITSRTELSEENLRKEIGRYEAGLLSY